MAYRHSHILAVSSCRKREGTSSLVSFLKHTNSIRGPHIHLYLITSLRSPSPNTITVAVRVSTYMLGGTQHSVHSRKEQHKRQGKVLIFQTLGVRVRSVTVVSDSFATPWAVQPARILCPWDFSGKNTGGGCHFLFQGIFLTQGLNLRLLCLLHWWVDSLLLPDLGSPQISWR